MQLRPEETLAHGWFEALRAASVASLADCARAGLAFEERRVWDGECRGMPRPTQPGFAAVVTAILFGADAASQEFGGIRSFGIALTIANILD